MAELIKFGSTSNIIEFTLKDKSTGQGKTGLNSSTVGLIISTKCDNEATPTVYTQAASHIEAISALGTFATPTSNKCRFSEYDSVNHKGLYQFQFADARFAITNSKRLIISVNDAESSILDADYQIQFVQFDPYDAVHLGLSAIPNVASGSAGAIITSGTGAAQLKTTSGIIDLPAITSNWLTSVGIAANALNGKGDWTVGDVRLLANGLSLIKDSSNTYDMKQLLIMVFEAAFYGRISGLPGGPAVLRDFANTINRATITFDTNNNRTGITINNAP